MDTARVTSKGQVTIPKRVRNLLAIETGDHLESDLGENGSLHVSRVRPEKRPPRGLLSDYAKPERIDEARVRAALL